MQIVTGYTGTEHVSSAMDGAQNAGAFGTGQYVLATGNQLKATMQTSNTVRILDGDVMVNGRHGYIAAGSYDDLTVQSGTSGYNRNDLVCARYTINASTNIEDISLVVVKGTQTTGTAADPSYNSGSVLEGATTVDMPLWRIPLTGITVGTPVQLFNVIASLKTLQDSASQILWTNPNPSSAFAAQTVTLPENDCTHYAVLPRASNNEDMMIPRVDLAVGKRALMINISGTGTTSSGTMVLFTREITASSRTSLTFGAGATVQPGGSFGQDDGRCIPIQVIGYKIG